MMCIKCGVRKAADGLYCVRCGRQTQQTQYNHAPEKKIIKE